jgi:hypothetical protein
MPDLLTTFEWRRGIRDGRRDSRNPEWLAWLTATIHRCDKPETATYLAGYIVGMGDRFAELQPAS